MHSPVSPAPEPPQQRLAGILATAMDAVITIDAQQRIVLFNEAAARMFKVTAQEALGQPLDRLIPLPRREAHRDHVQRYARGDGVARSMSSVRALTGLRSDGEEFPIEASISHLGDGQEVLMTVMVRDVTVVREAERARLARAAADAANRAKTEFLSRMSHELRTPLNAVLGMAQLLEASLGERATERELHQFELMQTAGQQLRTLIDNVLDLSRLEGGEIHIEAREAELCTLLDSAMTENASLAAAQQVQLHAVYEVDRPFALHADPARLRQIVSNLISNGIKFQEQGGLVRVQAKRQQDCVRISVIDRGMGMTSEQQASLFEPFNRLGLERSGIDGAGIGMALTRQLVALMGGSMSVESAPGEGTSVHVNLPINQADLQPSGTVLYIEDNAVNALLVVEVLRQWPQVWVVVAEDGGAGLEQARRLQPDLVLLDMQLPDMDGLRVLQELKQDPATRELKVVALSANAMEQDVDATLRAGACAYWTKPIDFTPFLEKMRALLTHRCAG